MVGGWVEWVTYGPRWLARSSPGAALLPWPVDGSGGWRRPPSPCLARGGTGAPACAVMCVCVCVVVCGACVRGCEPSVGSGPPLASSARDSSACTHATRCHQAQADRGQWGGARVAKARQTSEGGVSGQAEAARAEEARGEPEPTECLQAQGQVSPLRRRPEGWRHPVGSHINIHVM